jgi:hypothetical protein
MLTLSHDMPNRAPSTVLLSSRASLARALPTTVIPELRVAWRVALLMVVLCLGGVLAHVARWFADGMAVNAQLYFHAFRIEFIRSPWVFAPMRFLSAAVLQYSALASWSFACGYVATRAANGKAHLVTAGFAAIVLVSTAWTTTSVRNLQPWFFAPIAAAAVYPIMLKLAFILIPAWSAARAAARHTASVPVILVIGCVGLLLTWWNVSDLGAALNYGCVLPGNTRGTCTSRESYWGVAAAVTLIGVTALMMCDAAAPRRRAQSRTRRV